MPRPELVPAPPEAVLAERPLHAVARDFPETLAVFRAHGVDVPRRGAAPIAAAAEDAGPLLADLAAAMDWRGAARP
ncbi:MAG TPA: hypothetical protein VF188_04700 [Longimicrobiales bacterium]